MKAPTATDLLPALKGRGNLPKRRRPEKLSEESIQYPHKVTGTLMFSGENAIKLLKRVVRYMLTHSAT
jgi:hypothetical protein